MARELSAKVRASIPTSFNAFAPSKNLVVSSFLGGSSSTIIDDRSLTISWRGVNSGLEVFD